FGYALEGEIMAAQKKWSEATLAVKMAIKRQPAPVLALRLYGLLEISGKHADASAFASTWVKENPKDATLPLMLAQQSQQENDYKAAAAAYKKVLDIDPDNVVALNNLAWILSEQKDPAALEYAEHAHRLAPFNAGVIDTLGWALTRTGDAKRGVELLRMASNIASGQPDIRLHFAQALIATGDKADARKELTELTKLDKSSPIRAEAEKLLGTL
ncbi:MAG: tetratricopeptide repeat protein, partial [Betaproteobacteria bacterium]|nr:tetratricopeptide repeat protein [Betaproteobacteria bacterium]